MKTLTIGFSRSNKLIAPFSWLIRLFQGTTFSHVYIRLPFKRLGVLPSDGVVHASNGLVHYTNIDSFKKKHKVMVEFSISITEDQWHRLLIDMHTTAGEDYSNMQNIGIALVHILHLFGIRATNPWKSGWNCSEYVGHILRIVYPEEMRQLRRDLITPKDVYNVLNNIM
jgi:hypothetical protein